MINQRYTRKFVYEARGAKYYSIYVVKKLVASDCTDHFSKWVIMKRDEELRIFDRRSLKQGE